MAFTAKTTFATDIATGPSGDRLGARGHASIHNNIGTVLNNLQDKVGIDNSPDENSLDFKVAALQTSNDSKASTASLTAHTSASSAHGVNGSIVGTSDTQALTNKTIDASSNTLSNVSLTTAVTGTLPEANGGTGESSYTNGQLLIGNASGGLTKATLTAGSNVTITNGDGAITIASSGGGGGSGGYETVQEEGSDLTQRTKLNFVGSGITAADDSGNSRTNVTLDATLNSLSALGTAADKLAYTTGTDTWAEADISSFGRSLIDDAAASNARSTLGLVIGTNVQAWDADLDTWATKTAPSGTVVGHTDSQTLTNKTIDGDDNTLTDLPAANLKIASQAQGDVLYASSASVWARLGAGTSGQFLKTQGASANPIWADVTGGDSRRTIQLDWSNVALPDTNFPSIGRTVGTNWIYKTLDFDQTTSEACYFYFRIPSDLTPASAAAKVDWTASSGSGTFTASIVTRSPSDDEVIDATTTPSSASAVTATDTLIATGDLHQFSVSLTTTGWASGDLIQMKFSRDVADTLSGDAKVLAITVELR